MSGEIEKAAKRKKPLKTEAWSKKKALLNERALIRLAKAGTALDKRNEAIARMNENEDEEEEEDWKEAVREKKRLRKQKLQAEKGKTDVEGNFTFEL